MVVSIRLAKLILGIAYGNSLHGKGINPSLIESNLSCGGDEIRAALADLVAKKWLRHSNGEYFLTDEGRRQIRVVLTGGVFDVIHPGHIHTLTQARSLGDILVVSVARDSTVRKLRGKPALFNEHQRAELLRSLKLVDHVYLGSEKNIYDTVRHVKPDIIALGYDQKHRVEEVEAESRKLGVDVTVIRLTSTMPDIKSSKIKADDRFDPKG